MRESTATGMQGAGEWSPPTARRWSNAQGRAMARAFAASGDTQVEFARRHGLGPERVRRWLARVAERQQRPEPVAFAPVRLVERAPERRGGVEIVVGGRVVRVGPAFCPETLRQVLAALEEVAC
jgi:transposase-like protein